MRIKVHSQRNIIKLVIEFDNTLLGYVPDSNIDNPSQNIYLRKPLNSKLNNPLIDLERLYPECLYQLKNQLNTLKFFNVFPTLSPNGQLWLEIIKELILLLRISAKDRRVLRKKAKEWVSEVNDMAPWTNEFLERKFGRKHHIQSQISDGRSDHSIEDVALEDKLLRSSDNINNENLIKGKYNPSSRQVKRGGILSGFQILVIVDIREEIIKDQVDAIPIPHCFKIFRDINNYWTAGFLFQAFQKAPSFLHF